MGRIIPYIMENKKHVPNHHPAISSYLLVDNYYDKINPLKNPPFLNISVYFINGEIPIS
jgi:hypothetical protein